MSFLLFFQMGESSMMPMRGILAGCCARAAIGHTAAPPPRSVMNSRRRMCPSRPILNASPGLSANQPYSAAPHAYYFT